MNALTRAAPGLFLLFAASCGNRDSIPSVSLAVAGVPPALVSGPSDSHFVRGIETPAILASLRGRIVRDRPVGGVESIQLPSLTSTTLRPASVSADDAPTTFAVVGPDALGNVVYVRDHIVKKEHALVVIEANTLRERVIFQGAGSALLDKKFGRGFALTRAGDRVAYIREPKGFQNPGALLEGGTIEICDISTGIRTSTEVTALDGSLSWSQDGDRLIYACLLDRAKALSAAGRHFEDDREFQDRYDGWSRLPVVCMLDIATNSVETLCIGEHPVLSPDGTKLIVRDTKILMRMLRLDTDTWSPFELVGMTFPGVLAFVDNDTVIYPAWPTEGETAVWTTASPVAGKKQNRTLKVRRLGTDEFATIVNDLDPRGSVSFGAQ